MSSEAEMKSQMRRLAQAEIVRNPPPAASPELVARITVLLHGDAPADQAGALGIDLVGGLPEEARHGKSSHAA
jgi:hypothetical protein